VIDLLFICWNIQGNWIWTKIECAAKNGIQDLGFTDPRSPTSAMTILNDSMVNTLHVFHDGIHVLTGDSLGALKTWDTRNRACIQTQLNEPTQKPISHITTAGRGDGEEPRWLGVSSYDNVVRVWDRGISPLPDATRYRLGLSAQ
jgi:WD40 repeat protein